MTSQHADSPDRTDWAWPAWKIVVGALWPATVLALYLRFAVLPALLRLMP